MGKFINPFTDFGFKLIFGQELTKDLLIDFLNDLLEGERVIVDIIFLNNEQLPTIAEERAAIYDVYCRTDNGEYIIVEMQYRWHPHFKDRALYYTSRAIQGQGVKGIGWDFELAPVYGIFFMNFADEFTKLRTDAIVTDRDTGELLTNKLRLTYLSMPFFTKTEEECDTNFERWIYVLKNMKTLERMPFTARKAILARLEEVASIAALSPEDRDKYQHSIDNLNVQLGMIDGAEQKGIEKGIEKGFAKGVEQEKRSVVLNAHALRIPIEMISQLTGLSIEQIREILTEQN